MSAVLAITDRRSALFQILFAVFDSLEGFIIVMVHCILRREVSGWDVVLFLNNCHWCLSFAPHLHCSATLYIEMQKLFMVDSF